MHPTIITDRRWHLVHLFKCSQTRYILLCEVIPYTTSHSHDQLDIVLMHLSNRSLWNWGGGELKDRREQHLLQFMYTKKDDTSFRKIRRRSGVQTRAGTKINFILKKPGTEKFKKCDSYLGPKKWNALPVSIQKAENKYIFRAKLTKLLKNRRERNANTNVYANANVNVNVSVDTDAASAAVP